MRKSILFFVFFLPIFCFSQVVDDFSDGDFTANPAWSGSTNLFIVNGAEQLQSNAGQLSSAASYYLSTASTFANDCEWGFWVNLKFSVTGANYVDVFLISDNADLQATNINGYFVRIGETNKKISLYKRVNGANSEVIVGETNVVNSSSNNLLKIKIIRKSDNSWTLEYDRTGTGNSFVPGGSFADNVTPITVSSFMGVFIQQSNAAAPANNHFFDDIYVGEIIPDTTPPLWTDLSITSPNKLTLIFSEEMDFSTASFVLSPSEKSPVSTNISADRTTIELTFANNFEENIYYTLIADGLTDIAGNALQNTQRRTGICGTVEEDDLVWNEVMFDNLSDGVEYVEIANRSNKLLDLSDLQFSTVKADGSYNTAVIIPAKTIIEPHGYVAFTNYRDSLCNYYGLSDDANIFETARWNALANTGATLVLMDKDQNVVFDRFTYSPNWHNPQLEEKKGVSLERVNPDLPTQQIHSWQSASTNVNYGTPGYRNSQYREMNEITPLWIDLSLELPNKLILSFSKKMNVENASFVLSPSEKTPVSSSISDDKTVVELIFSDSFEENIYYTLTVNNLTDLDGNSLEQTQRRIGIPTAAEMGDLVWNEVMFDVATNGLSGVEYVEIANRSNKLLDLSGLLFTSVKSDGSLNTAVEIPAKTIVEPHGCAAFCADKNLLVDYFGLGDDVPVFEVSRWNTLNNTSATLLLLDTDKTTVFDELTYNASWHNPTLESKKGVSLERINPDLVTQLSYSWYSATTEVNYGTPGTQNSQYREMSEILPLWTDLSIELPNKLILSFSKKMNLTNAKFVLLPDEISPVSSTLLSNGHVIELAFAENFTFAENVYYTLTVDGLADLFGNPLEQPFQRIGIPKAIEEGDLVWNEVMFDAPSGSVEYVEIVNRSENLLDLAGLLFSTVKSDGSYNTLVTIPAKTFVEPHGYAAFCNHTDSLRNYFGLGSEANIIRTEKWTSLNNSSATLVLLGSDETTIYDELTYSAKWHHPLVKNPRGVALERINPDLPTQDPNSWHSAASAVKYGTPGYHNSQYMENATSSDVQDKVVWLDSEIFSPDNDGVDDVCFIRYNMGESGYTANIIIFNAVGERVYQLASNALLGNEGFFTWDGKTDKGTNVNVGIYVLYFQAVNATNGNRKEIKLPVVISAR